MGLVSILLWGSLVALLIFYLWSYLTRNRDYWTKLGIPTLHQPTKIFKRSTMLETESELYNQRAPLGFAGTLQLFGPALYVHDLDLIKNIFVKDFESFVNRQAFKVDDHFFNEMLVNKEDKEWKDLRSTMSPTFTTSKIRNMFQIMHDSSKKFVSYLNKKVATSYGDFEFEEGLGRCALDVIISAAVGVESNVFNFEDSDIVKFAQKMPLKFTPLFVVKLMLSTAFPKLSKLLNFKLMDEQGVKFFQKLILQTIKHRDETGTRRNDFLQLMIDTKNGQLQVEKESEEMDMFDKNAQLSQKGATKITEHSIVANSILFFIAGYDTTQSVLSFALYALALNPEAQQTLRGELQDALENANGGGKLTYEIVNQTEYLDQFINETQRRYPTFLGHGRVSTKDYTLPNGSVLPKGITVIIPWYHIHHDEKYFPNPTVFDPRRFSKEEKAKRHTYAFMPFGHGPRSCIAKRFALVEMKTILAELVLNFDFEPCEKTTIPMVFSNTAQLKPTNGMWLRIKSRING